MNTSDTIQSQIMTKKQKQMDADLRHAEQKVQTSKELDSLRKTRDFWKDQEKAQSEQKKAQNKQDETSREQDQWEQEGERLAQEEGGRLEEESLLERLIRLTSDNSEERGRYGN